MAPGPPYVRRRYLLVWWQGGEAVSRNQLLQLQQILFHTYRMQGETYEIPTQGRKDATSVVRERMRTFRDQSNGNELLIIVYGGHGIVAAQTKHLRWVTGGDYFVDWNGIQNDVLFESPNDTLVILDCCYAGAADRAMDPARKDILAACDGDNKTPVDAGSFTSCLLEVLKQPTSPLTPKMLHDRVLRRLPKDHVRPHYSSRPYNVRHEIDIYPSDYSIMGSGGGPASAGGAGAIALASGMSNLSVGSGNANAQWNTCIEIIIRWPVFIAIRICWGHKHRGQAANARGYQEEADELLECSNVPDNQVYRRQSDRFYEVGRVFAVPWSSETNPPNVADAPRSSGVSAREERVFLVVRSENGASLVVPVSGRWDERRRSNAPAAQSRGLIFSDRNPPPSEKTMARPVRAQLDDRAERLPPTAQIDYGTWSRVRFDVPVRSLGRIHNEWMSTFVYNSQSLRRSGTSPEATQTAGRQTISSLTGATSSTTQIAQAGPSQRAVPYATSSTTAAAQGSGTSIAALTTRVAQFKEAGYPDQQIAQMLMQHLSNQGHPRERAAAIIRQAMSQYNNEDSEDGTDEDEEENYTTRRPQASAQVGAPRQSVAVPRPSAPQQTMGGQVRPQPQPSGRPSQRTPQAGVGGNARRSER